MLTSGPSSSFTIPGVVLLMVVGGTHARATVLLFSTGSAQLILALALLGVVVWLPRAPLAAAGRSGR